MAGEGKRAWLSGAVQMSERKRAWLRWASTKLSDAVFSVLSVALGGVLVLTQEKKHEDQRQASARDMARTKARFRLEEFHRDGYSKCMRDMVRYERKHKADYASVFKKQMEAVSNEAKEDVERINECRSRCKEYWRMVHVYSRTYGLDEEEIAEFEPRHERFKKLVLPLDNLDGYTTGEKAVYDFKRFQVGKEERGGGD